GQGRNNAFSRGLAA
ncbi:putative mannose-6-phosphate isomerase, partial [Serratia symbiotica str. Tucson]